MEKFLGWCLEYKIPNVSIYTLSTENLNRPKKEVQHILRLVEKKIEELMNDERIHKNKVQLKFCGKLHKLPPRVIKTMKKAMNMTEEYRKAAVNFLIAYGGQYEIVNMVNQILTKALKKAKEKGENRVVVTPKTVKENLLVKEPLDLIIRTGGEHRLSNFMPWQSSYAELYVTPTLWPAFTKKNFLEALNWYSERKRRFGR